MLVSEILSKAKGLINNGFNDKAITLLGDIFQQQSENPEIHFLLIHLLQQQQDFENSENVLIDAEKKFSGALQLILLRSSQSKGVGDHQQSIKYLYQFLEINQENPIVWATLAQLLEQLNRLEELEKLLDKIPIEFNTRPLIALVKAKLFRRQSNLQSSLQTLDLIEDSSGNHWLSAAINFEYSRTFDKIGEYDKAWSYAIKANNSTSFIWPERWQKSIQIEQMLMKLTEQKLNQQATSYEQIAPCFLIGFPRSGTTLLGRILDNHRDISVMDEAPIIEKIASRLGGFDYLEQLDSLTEDDMNYFREEYFLHVKEKHATYLKDKVFIDKLPLNILYLPLINKIFPNSKIIFSVRHPIDCCLSSFLQEFVAAPALVNFLTFEQSISFYHNVFSATEKLLENNSKVIHIRYEDIASNLEPSISKVLDFLGVKWEPQMEDFYEHAKNHQINTPSYDQVVKPLYKDSIYRFKNYVDYCESAEKKLQHWIVKFGYQDI